MFCLSDQTSNPETTNTDFFFHQNLRVYFVWLTTDFNLFENQDRPKSVDKNFHFYHFLVYLDFQSKICFESKTNCKFCGKKSGFVVSGLGVSFDEQDNCKK